MASPGVLVGEIKHERFSLRLEESFFGILFTLTQAHEIKYAPEMVKSVFFTLIDFVEVAGILLFNPFHQRFGPALQNFGLGGRWLLLNIDPPDYDSFMIFFWIASFITLLILANALLVGSSFWNKSFSHVWAVQSLHTLVAVILKWFFLASVNIFLIPLLCHPTLGTVNTYKNVVCFDWPNVLPFSLSVVFISVLLILVFSATLAKVNFMCVQFDSEVTVTPLYTMIILSFLTFFIVNEKFLSFLYGSYAEVFMNLLFLTGCLLVLIYYLPFHSPRTNRWQAGIRCTHIWICICTLFTINKEKAYENTVIDFVTIAGIVPSFIIGVNLIQWRYVFLKVIALGVINEIEMKQDEPKKVDMKRSSVGIQRDFYDASGNATKRRSIKYNEIVELEEQKALVNPRLYIPKSLSQYSWSESMAEIIGRFLWFDPDNEQEMSPEIKTKIAPAYYNLIEKAFPESARISLMKTTLSIHLSLNANTIQDKLELIKKMKPSFSIRYAMFKRYMEIKQKLAASRTSGKEALDLVAYVEFQKYLLEAQKYHDMAILSLKTFWGLFLQPNITVSKFNQASHNIETQTRKALETYKTLISKYPKAHRILSSYAKFLQVCLNEEEEAAKNYRKADELRTLENDTTGGINDNSLGKQAIITINEEGIIVDANKHVMAVYGWAKSDLIGRNVKIIVPSPWKDFHNLFIERYQETGESKIIGNPKTTFGLHKQGYAFKMTLDVRETKNEAGERTFLGIVNVEEVEQLKSEIGEVIATTKGQILMITEPLIKIFGYNATELVGKNVTTFMTDSYASSHARHLERYLSSGEPHVIGTAGRNLPGKKRNGQVFPISLIVEEEIIAEERYFLAKIVEVSKITGNVFINGFGVIQDCDETFCKLFGYFSSDLIGENIKKLMEGNYADYHDLYLERYRKTQKAKLVGAGQRVVPAVHADGSKMNMRIGISREDIGDDSDGNKMLFKGTFSRVIGEVEVTLAASKVEKSKYDELMAVEFASNSFLIKKIQPELATMLGYDSPDFFKNVTMDAIIPPLPDQDFNNGWFEKCHSHLNESNYVYVLTRSKTLIPASIQMSKKGKVYRLFIANLYDFESLITVNQTGIVTACSPDAELLFGHETLLSQNIKKVTPPEVVDKHDGYLKHFFETGDTQMIGVPRKVMACHRFGMQVPVEIFISEKKFESGPRSFILKVKHQQIKDKVDADTFAEAWQRVESSHSLDQAGMGSQLNLDASANLEGLRAAGSDNKLKSSVLSLDRKGQLGNPNVNFNSSQSNLKKSGKGNGSQLSVSARQNVSVVSLARNTAENGKIVDTNVVDEEDKSLADKATADNLSEKASKASSHRAVGVAIANESKEVVSKTEDISKADKRKPFKGFFGRRKSVHKDAESTKEIEKTRESQLSVGRASQSSGVSDRSGTSGISGTSTNTNNGISESLSNKVAHIKNSTKVDSAILRLDRSWKMSFFLLLMFPIASLIGFFFYEYPHRVITITSVIMPEFLKMNGLFDNVRELMFLENSTVMLGDCSWGVPIPPDTRPICEATTSGGNNATQRVLTILNKNVRDAIQSIDDFRSTYRDTKLSDITDEMDQALRRMKIYSLNETANNNRAYMPTDTVVGTFWDVMAALTEKADLIHNHVEDQINQGQYPIDLTDVLGDVYYILANADPFSELMSEFISTLSMASYDYVKWKETWTISETIFIASFCICVYLVVILPQLIKINNERLIILNVVMLVPKNVIYELIVKKYKNQGAEKDDSSDEEEDLAVGDEAKETSGKGLKKIYTGNTKILKENNILFYFGIFLLILLVAAPAGVFTIIHFASKPAIQNYNVAMQHSLEALQQIYEIKRKSFRLFSDCENDLCDTFESKKTRLSTEISKLHEIFFTELFPVFHHEKKFLDLLFAENLCLSPQKERCDAELAQKNKNSYISNFTQIGIPDNFAVRTTKGINSIITEIEETAQLLAQISDQNRLDANRMWFIYSIVEEGYLSIQALLDALVNTITEDVVPTTNINVIICYAVTIFYIVVIFGGFFRRLRHQIQSQSIHKRSIIGMIPLTVIKKNRQIKEFVEKMYVSLLD